MASRRPWRVVAFVTGFDSRRTVLQFEHAWQCGFRHPCMRYATRFVPKVGVLGRLQLLPTLLRTGRWCDHELNVRLVLGGATPDQREVRWADALRPCAWCVTHVQTPPP